jgi:hypothetical protein
MATGIFSGDMNNANAGGYGASEGMSTHQQHGSSEGMSTHQQNESFQSTMAGGRRRRRRSSRSRGRKGRGGYLMDAAVAAGLLGVTQLSKRRAGYGFTGRNGYYAKTRRRGSKRSNRSKRTRGRR